jgi:putative hydrolase of the HAD superfamily
MIQPKLIILDLDDTLYSEYDFVLSGFKFISKLVSASVISLNEKQVYSFLSLCFKQSSNLIFDRLIDHFSLHRFFKVSELISFYKYHEPTISIFDDVIPFLSRMKLTNIPVVLLTDGDVVQQKNKVKALKIDSFFLDVFYSDSYGVDKRKPNTFMYLMILEKLKLDPSQVLNIGDNPKKDFYVNKSLGIKTIQINRKNAIYSQKFPYFKDVKPNTIINSLNDVDLK